MISKKRNICLTIVILQDGKIVLTRSNNGKYTIFPKTCMKEPNSIEEADINLNNGLGKAEMINDDEDYKRIMGTLIHFTQIGTKKGFSRSKDKIELIDLARKTIKDIGFLDEKQMELIIKESLREETISVDYTGFDEDHFKSKLEPKFSKIIGKFFREKKRKEFKRTADGIEYLETVEFRYMILGPNISDFNFPESFSLDKIEELVKNNDELCEKDLVIAMRQVKKSKLRIIIEAIRKHRNYANKETISDSEDIPK